MVSENLLNNFESSAMQTTKGNKIVTLCRKFNSILYYPLENKKTDIIKLVEETLNRHWWKFSLMTFKFLYLFTQRLPRTLCNLPLLAWEFSPFLQYQIWYMFGNCDLNTVAYYFWLQQLVTTCFYLLIVRNFSRSSGS